MSTPIDHGYPVKRPGMIISASWIGADDDLALQVGFTNENGQAQSVQFPTTNAGGMGKVCLPTSATVNDLDSDAVIASVRMGTFISKMIPGSKEWMDAMTTIQEGSRDFQTAIGNVKIDTLRIMDDQVLQVDIKKSGTSNPIRTLESSFHELGTYVLGPDNAMKVIPGAIKATHPTYVHNHPSQVLSQAQKDAIVATVMALELWA